MNHTKETGAIRFSDNENINRLLNQIVSQVRHFTQEQVNQVKRLSEIGLALSAEKDLNHLLELIVQEARNFTCADGGTLYLTSDDERELIFAIVQNNTLKIRMGGTGDKIAWPPVPLRNQDGTANNTNVSAYAANSGKIVSIEDVYNTSDFNFEGTRRFDAQTGFRSKSMLVVPMRDHEGTIIGVLQLLNAKDEMTGEVINFPHDCRLFTEALASQAAISISHKRLISDLEKLFEAVIKTIASAIDEKSPYTGGHVRRVADLTLAVAQAVNDSEEEAFKELIFSEDQKRELIIAAWLHDLGKIATPEYIVNKATKLQTVCDRIELLKTRFEVLKRDRQIFLLRQLISPADCNVEINLAEDPAIIELEEDIRFLSRVNAGTEMMDNRASERLRKIASLTWQSRDGENPVLTADELNNLSLPYGTLTNAEREIINHHVEVTARMLSLLPFPKKFKNVVQYAVSHHEKLNGKGYPFGKKENDLSLGERIIALADVFEALTARDRPYKKGNSLSQAMGIMKSMVEKGEIDPKLFRLFFEEKIYLKYAEKELSPTQLELSEFETRG